MASYKGRPFTGNVYTDTPKTSTLTNQFNRVGDRIVEVKEITVHKFKMGDVEDPVLYAGEPLYRWQQSEAGQWVIEHAVETPSWHRYENFPTYEHHFVIRARLKVQDITYFLLKFGAVEQVDFNPKICYNKTMEK